MENRNYFSLHCLQMETQLIHANLEILYDVLGDMAAIEARSHSDVSIHEYRLWHDHGRDDPQKIQKERFNSWRSAIIW